MAALLARLRAWDRELVTAVAAEAEAQERREAWEGRHW